MAEKSKNQESKTVETKPTTKPLEEKSIEGINKGGQMADSADVIKEVKKEVLNDKPNGEPINDRPNGKGGAIDEKADLEMQKKIIAGFEKFKSNNTVGTDKFKLVSSVVEGNAVTAVVVITKAMEIKDTGCFIERIYAYGGQISNSISFAPGTYLFKYKDENDKDRYAVKPMKK